MEKRKEEQKKAAEQISKSRNQAIWDCGSSLYDSYELKALQKQLDSAISSRTLSMPHISDRRRPPSPPQPSTSKVSRSFQKLIRAVFRPKRRSMTNKDDKFGGRFGYEQSKEGFYVIYDMPPSLQRTASERFAAYTSTGISCS